MYHVALVNITDKEIQYAEQYEKKDDAIARVVKGLEPQAMLNSNGWGTCEAGKEWVAYGPADEPFEFKEDEIW